MSGCCVSGCNNRYTPGTSVRFYKIPGGRRQFQVNRRRLWIEAIQRANGSSSEIGPEVRICGAHFVTGEASTDQDRPNFVPTLFTCTKQPKNPRKNTKWASGHQKGHRQKEYGETKTATTTTRREDEKTENTRTLRKAADNKNTGSLEDDADTENSTTLEDDAETEKSPTQPTSESPSDHLSPPLMETGDKLSPEIQTLLYTSVSKEEETEDKTIYDKDQGLAKSKTKPETIKPENTSCLNMTPSQQKPPVIMLKRDKMNPVVLLKPLVLPQGAYLVNLRNETFTAVSPREQHEETDMSQMGSAEPYSNTRDQPSFPCNLCDRTFTTSHYLKRHKLLHVRDVRKCLRCGTLFCRRHNHVLFQTQPEPLPESEESSSGSEDGLLDSNVNKDKEEASKITEMADHALSKQTDTPPDSPALTNSPLLKTFPLTDIGKPLLVSVKPAAVPSPPSPIFRFPNNQGTLFQFKPLLSGSSLTLTQPHLPQQPQPPSSLKIFSAQHLTSALLDVQRNYEYILSKPKKKEVKIKEEPDELVQICPVEPPVKQVKLEKIAYDLEMVI